MKTILFITFLILITNFQSFSQCACCAGASAGSSTNLTNSNLLTLPKGKWMVEGYGDYRTIKPGGDHETADTTEEETGEETPLQSMLITSIGVRYGISDNVTVSAILPYAFLYTAKGQDMGLGDLILLGTFNVLKKNNFNLALRAGVELPTGIQKGASFDNTTVVIGSGSVDPMAGIALSKRWDKVLLQGDGLFKYTTRGFEKTNFGNLSIQNIALSYMVVGGAQDSIVSKQQLAWSVSAGYYGEWLDKIKVDTETDENTGYYLGYATLGTSLTYRSVSIPVTFSYPVIQAMNSSQSDSGYRLRVGVQKMF